MIRRASTNSRPRHSSAFWVRKHWVQTKKRWELSWMISCINVIDKWTCLVLKLELWDLIDTKVMLNLISIAFILILIYFLIKGQYHYINKKEMIHPLWAMLLDNKMPAIRNRYSKSVRIENYRIKKRMLVIYTYFAIWRLNCSLLNPNQTVLIENE